MGKRTDLKKILIIGSGPIVIGQACEFDYSGTQALKALKEEGYLPILLNNNPATIMTDPEFSYRTYIEPITLEVLEEILKIERPDAILPTLGGQTALNLAVAAGEAGLLDKYNVELIGASLEAIKKAEDRDLFKKSMEKIGLSVPKSVYVKSVEEAKKAAEELGFPLIIRPSFTLGGTGGSIAYNKEEFLELVDWGLRQSMAGSVLLEESLLGWKEFELEVMRDKADNVVIICSIENFDPMGIHTGDSITVAPAQTLTNREYQLMRDAAISVIREIGVDTGGSNIQFAINPENGRMVVIEMNPRVSRSSALASKATGFPIAKIAAKLAVGYTLDEIPNDITKKTPSCFEPTIDYVVVKIPRFDFEKFPQTPPILTTQMKSVGEVMAIGRTFQEALQKAIRSLEKNYTGFNSIKKLDNLKEEDARFLIEKNLRIPNPERLWYIGEAFRRGFTIDEIYSFTRIDPWFLNEIKKIIEMEGLIKKKGVEALKDKKFLMEIKRTGFSDERISELLNISPAEVKKRREEFGLFPSFKCVDTCAAEFEAFTPYMYSSYETEKEVKRLGSNSIVVLGSGPNRIAQGVEFDYCCVHCCFALREEGYKVIMVNCNPETVSTDYDTSDRLYFEPITEEDVLEIVRFEKPLGVILQFGGQTPLKLAVPLERAGVPVLGTSPQSIDIAEDRDRCQILLRELKIPQPENGVARSREEALIVARRIGYPVMVRPSYVLGGRAMVTVYSDDELLEYIEEAVSVSPEHPVLIDRFLSNAVEVDVDAVSDGKDVYIGGVLEHIEEAGVHSGDSACSIPPRTLKPSVISRIVSYTKKIARKLRIIGLMNVQYAVKDDVVYVLEINPRASRTVPFISKATGIPLAKVAAKVIVGRKLKDLIRTQILELPYTAVKEAVFPFDRFPEVDTILGAEMKSTGEVMGIDEDFGHSFYKSQVSAGNPLPTEGVVFISVKDDDKPKIVEAARKLKKFGFEIYATKGTWEFLKKNGIESKMVYKVTEGQRPHIVDLMKNREIHLVINTTWGKKSIEDSRSIRRTAVNMKIPYVTTIEAAYAVVEAIASLKKKKFNVKSIQEYYESLNLSEFKRSVKI